MKNNRLEKILIPFGMIAVISYLIHTTLGDFLWPDYNPITTDISSLTAVGAPNAQLLGVFTLIYSVFAIVLGAGMLIRAFRAYNKSLKTGYIIFMVMQIISLIGYNIFPISKDIDLMAYQNIMHLVVTGIVVVCAVAFGFFIAVGYLKQDKTKKFGRFALVMAILITLFGVFNPISMGLNLDIMGISERLVIFSLMVLIFAISNFETFANVDVIDMKNASENDKT